MSPRRVLQMMTRVSAGSGALIAAALLVASPLAAQDDEWLDCVMYPEAELRLGFGDSGLLEEVLVEPGHVVEQGAVIARQVADIERIRIDALMLRLTGDASIAAQQARIAFIDQRLDRTRSLAERNISTDAQLQELLYERTLAQTGLQQAEEDRAAREIELQLAQTQLERRTLKAPADGVILEVFRRPGEYAERNDAVVRLGILDPLRVRAFPGVMQLGSVMPGDTAQVMPDTPFETVAEARVSFVSTQIDPASRTFVVEALLPNPGLELPGGHRCRISFR